LPDIAGSLLAIKVFRELYKGLPVTFNCPSVPLLPPVSATNPFAKEFRTLVIEGVVVVQLFAVRNDLAAISTESLDITFRIIAGPMFCPNYVRIIKKALINQGFLSG
jgi:hypothetical protein